MNIKPILFICSKTDLTADLVLLELKKEGVPVIRINTEDFPTKLAFSIHQNTDKNAWIVDLFNSAIKKRFALDQIRSVYCRPYKEPRPSRLIKNPIERSLIIEQCQLLIEWLEDLLPCFWLNSPRAVAKSRSKVLQLTIAKQLGFLTPDSLITNNPEAALDFYSKHDSNIVAKLLQATPSTRRLKGFIFTTKINSTDLKLFYQIKYSPVLLQQYIEKQYEIRATVVGNQVFAAKIDSQCLETTKDDWRCYKFGSPPPHIPIELPLSVQSKLFKMNEKLGLKFGAYDLIYTPKEDYVFLEVNGNGQWGWIQELTKMPISKAIARLLINCGK